MKILIVEDDSILSSNIADALQSEGYSVVKAFDGLLAEKMMLKENYDCIILDINLPGKTGFDICRDFRKTDTFTPILMLTAFGELEDKVKGFDLGADDYLTKPFYMRELIIRVNSLLKRSSKNPGDAKKDLIYKAGDITLDDGKKQVFRNSEIIKLTPREYQILLKLIKNKGEIISKSQLIEEIWGSSFTANTNTIEVYINFLRNKLDKPFGSHYIKTKVGYGYYFDNSENSNL